MAFKLQEAFVDITGRLGGLRIALGKARGLVVTGLKGAATAAVAGVGLAFAGLAAAIGGAIPLAKLGSDLEEMRSKFSAVFKGEEGAARAFAENLAKGVGRSQIQIEGFMSSLQDLFVPMGFSRDQARELTQTVTQLGVDLASFNNMTDAEAIETLNSGLTGSHEVLKKFGVFINDNTLSLKLQEMGLAKNAQSATEQAKAMARLQIIMESTTDAHGDAAKTSDSLANQWKALTGSLFDLASEIGSSMVPAGKEVVGMFRSIADWVAGNSDKVKAMATQWGEAFTGFVQQAFEVFQQLVGFFQGIFARLVAMGKANWEAWGGGVTSAFGFVRDFIVGAVMMIVDAYVSWLEWLSQLGRSIIEFTGLGSSSFSGMGSTITKVWEWIKGAVGTAIGFIKNMIEQAIFWVLNWDIVTKKAGLAISQVFTNVWGRIKTFFENGVTLVKWFFDNWKDIAFTAFDFWATGFENLVKNIMALWRGLLDFFKTGKFDVDWTDLQEGARSTIKSMPEFKQFLPPNFDDQWDELDQETKRRWNKWKGIMEKNAPEAGKESGEGIAEGMEKGMEDKPPDLQMPKFDIQGSVDKKKDGKSDAGTFRDLASVWQDIQSNLLKKEDKIPQKQLKAQEQMVVEQKKLREDIARKGSVGTFA